MYLPDTFNVRDLAATVQLVRDYGFGTLVTSVDDTPYATHIPFLLDSEEPLVLCGHVARANPHWRHFSGRRSLAVFQGPHSYVSPAWYEQGGVPTWNYTAVHLYGHIEIVSDHAALARIVDELSDQYERDRDEPWIPDYGEGMLDAIVGFTFRVDEVQAKFKLSQNRSDTDRSRVEAELAACEDPQARATAAMMKALAR
jgi:transcriptional regulator